MTLPLFLLFSITFLELFRQCGIILELFRQCGIILELFRQCGIILELFRQCGIMRGRVITPNTYKDARYWYRHYNKDDHSLSCLGTDTIIKMPAHFPVLLQVL
jgi:hypothetical protein